MEFNFIQYFLFLPVVWVLHNYLAPRCRWVFLLIASYLFYSALGVPYLVCAIALVTITTYGFGFWLYRQKDETKKKKVLIGGILANVSILIVLKYLPFLTLNLDALLTFFHSPFKSTHTTLLVGIGVSYYVFQAISYLNDIYLEIEEPEPHFGYFALYLAFFPKLLQGPIERAGDLLPQLKQKYEFNYDNMRYGLLLFTWGLFKKVVLADRLGLYVDAVYDDVYSYQGLPLLLATYAYAFQIYFDFSGYTDMALGTARLFNIKLSDNFNNPYLATSIADFWRRWHITFSRWILDYIFKPLQMQWRNRKNWGTAAALVVTFFVSGVWHGASWGFILWGLLHGFYMACSVFCRPYQKKIYKALKLEKTKALRVWQIFVTFNLVSFAWIFFRSSSIEEAFYILKSVVLDINFYDIENIAIVDKYSYLVYIFLFIVVLINPLLEIHIINICYIFKKNIIIRWSFYIALLITTILFSVIDSTTFIYANF